MVSCSDGVSPGLGTPNAFGTSPHFLSGTPITTTSKTEGWFSITFSTSVEPPKGLKIRVRTIDVVQKQDEGVPLESASVGVAGGAGAGCLDGWKEIEALAEVLRAALGSTRPAVEEGWTELATMIGQSGKMVNPKLYMGIGVSGELQHMVGIVGAKVMIAINNNRKAPVFEQVDYRIVEDCR